MMLFQSYIDRMLCLHNRDTPKSKQTKNLPPLPNSWLKTIFQECGLDEGIIDVYKLDLSQGFGYHTLLGETLQAYVTCQSDIIYTITIISKFSTKPAKFYYELLKGNAKYLHKTKDQGIKYKQSIDGNHLAYASLTSDVIPDGNLPLFPVDINQPKLITFIDAAFANDQRKLQSTTGFVFTYYGSTIIYCSITHSITTINSTEADFIATVLCAKISLYLQSILYEFGFECNEPTPFYQDNSSTILIVNSTVTTKRA